MVEDKGTGGLDQLRTPMAAGGTDWIEKGVCLVTGGEGKVGCGKR